MTKTMIVPVRVSTKNKNACCSLQVRTTPCSLTWRLQIACVNVSRPAFLPRFLRRNGGVYVAYCGKGTRDGEEYCCGGATKTEKKDNKYKNSHLTYNIKHTGMAYDALHRLSITPYQVVVSRYFLEALCINTGNEPSDNKNSQSPNGCYVLGTR